METLFWLLLAAMMSCIMKLSGMKLCSTTFTQWVSFPHTELEVDLDKPLVIKCIRVIRFLHLKPGFRCILSSTVQKCAWKKRFYKPCTSAAPESEFDHAKRIPCLKVGVLVLYSVKIIKMSRLAFDCLLIPWSLHGSLPCCETDGKNFMSLDTEDVETGQLR